VRKFTFNIPSAILLNQIGDVLVSGTSWDGQSNDIATIEIVPPSALIAGDCGFGFRDGAFTFEGQLELEWVILSGFWASQRN